MFGGFPSPSYSFPLNFLSPYLNEKSEINIRLKSCHDDSYLYVEQVSP